MKGIRKRVLVSFLSVVVLLFFAGLVSLFELRRVSSDTEEILRASERNLGLAKDMLDAAARQNKAVVHSIVFRQRDYDTVLMGSIAEMARTLEVVRREAVEQAYLDTLSASAMNVQRLTQEFLRLQAQRVASEASGRLELRGGEDSLSMKSVEMDFDGARWYAEAYSKAYDKLTAYRAAQTQRLPCGDAGADLAAGDDCYRVDALLLRFGLSGASGAGDE